MPLTEATDLAALQFWEQIPSGFALRPVLQWRSIASLGLLCSTIGPLLRHKAGKASALTLDNLNYTTRTS